MKVQNPFPYTNDNKRYHTWNYHLRNEFGEKIFKVSLDAGFDCPNRDGTVAYGGCTFCSAAGSGDFAGDRRDDVITQYHEMKEKNALKVERRKMYRLFPSVHKYTCTT